MKVKFSNRTKIFILSKPQCTWYFNYVLLLQGHFLNNYYQKSSRCEHLTLAMNPTF